MRSEAFGLEVETLPNDWRRPADPARLEARLRDDKEDRKSTRLNSSHRL